ETDHLYGTMFIDRVEGEDKKNIWRKIRQADYNQVAAAVQGERAAKTSSGFGALGGSFGAAAQTGGAQTNRTQRPAVKKPGAFGI
ncbi:MAG TPA: hypothetical protein H9908_07875, partial [Candidatus Rothia avistercoris]|nr:hypothetical protein [Candidatus Rothia avistercoris]